MFNRFDRVIDIIITIVLLPISIITGIFRTIHKELSIIVSMLSGKKFLESLILETKKDISIKEENIYKIENFFGKQDK